MRLRRAVLFVVATMCLAACGSSSTSSDARIVSVESLSDGVTVETVPTADPPSRVVVVSAADGLAVPGWGVVWDRRVGEDWEPAFEAPYSIDAAVTPKPATGYIDGVFHEAIARVSETIWLSVPPESGVFRAEVGRDEFGEARHILVLIGD